MTPATITALVIVGILVVTGLAAVMTRVVYTTLKAPLEARIAEHLKGSQILMKDLRANCFGLESAGVFQPRGNGGLVLTESELHFFKFLPRTELQVPLDAIIEITLVRSHLGKPTLHKLLKVSFSLGGKMDSIAWYVTDPEAWQGRIAEVRSGAHG